MKTIKEIFGLSAVQEQMLVEKGNYKVPSDYKIVNPELIVGLELEIERLAGYVDKELRFRGFTFTEDGSLRDGGVEAITRPMYSKFVPEKLDVFFKHFGITPANYSERCSIHVHVNCQDLTQEEVKSVCMLYQITERLLFSFVGNEREESIFCAPWSQCGIQYGMLDDTIDGASRRWMKYTALNLLPLQDKGTIEFRHLEGTCDVGRIVTWLNLIGSLFAYAKANTPEQIKNVVMNINTISNYDAFINAVFGGYAYVFDSPRLALQDGVIDAKLMFTENKKAKEKVIATDRILIALEQMDRAFTANAPARMPVAPLLDAYINWEPVDQNEV